MKKVPSSIFFSLLKIHSCFAGDEVQAYKNGTGTVQSGVWQHANLPWATEPTNNSTAVLKQFVLFIIILFTAVAAGAQNQSKIDSLGYLAETTRDDSARVYLNVAISKEYSKNDVITSLDYGEKALAIAESSGNQRLISYSLFNMGVNYYRQGLMEQSIRYFSRYLEINQELADRKGIAYAMTNIGAIYLDINETDKASEYFKQALDGFEDLYAEAGKKGREVISIYNNLGIIARRHQQTDSAIYYYNRGISLARQTPGVKTELANLLNNLGNLYLDEGNSNEALIHFNEAYRIRLENNDQTGLIKSYLSLASHSQSEGDDGRSLEYLYEALRLAKNVGSVNSMAESQKMIFDLYSKRKQADSALKYHILYAGSRDSINEKAALKELRQFEITSRNNEKERMMQITAKRKELRYTLLIISLLVATLISSLLYFLARGRIRRHKLEKEVALLNTRNLELEKERLEIELEAQNKKLTTTDIYQIQKNEIINNIISKLQKHGITETRKHHSVWISDIINDLKAAQNQSAWEEFELRFQQVHNGFFKKLNEINPGLSPNDRRLCAFLKLNMTTKEISSITGQSYRSIEVARTRLRKKLNLTNSETGLIEFLSTL